MAGDYLLDTSVAIAVLRNDSETISRLSRVRAICTSTIVLGELLFGARRSRHPEEAKSRVLSLIATCPLVPHDEQTADHYSQLRAALAAKGKPIPENDIWIAASAHQYGLTLAARDDHFGFIDGLQFERW